MKPLLRKHKRGWICIGSQGQQIVQTSMIDAYDAFAYLWNRWWKCDTELSMLSSKQYWKEKR